jgi:hypothetical protein
VATVEVKADIEVAGYLQSGFFEAGKSPSLR